MARLISLGEPVTRGERKTLDYLQKHLPDDWLVIGNPQITTGELTREIDAIVIGDRCVWIIDEKGFGGRITGDEHVWLLENGSARERVLYNILHAASMLKGKLRAADSRLSGVWVEGLVLLSSDDAELRVSDARVASHARKLSGCEDYFLKANIPRARKLNTGEIQSVQKLLCGSGILQRLSKRFTQIGAFKVVEELSTTPLVRSFRAQRERTNDWVELKVYDLSALPDKRTREEVRKKAQQEFEALFRLRNTPGVGRSAASFQPDTRYGSELYYCAFDLPNGPCLASRISEPSWSFENRLKAARRLCEILQSIHKVKIVHRNLSPSCVHFWQSDYDFQLTGFEFSKIATGSASSLHFTPGDFVASPYTAPEVSDEPHNATEASDLYSLGIMIFEILSGARPFGNAPRSADAPDPALLIENGTLTEKQKADLEDLLHIMVAYEPNKRLQSVSDVLELFDAISQSNAGTVPTPVAVHPLPDRSSLGQFLVLGYLGSGGCFHAYRVAQQGDDTREYVAKVIRYPELLKTASRSFAALNNLDHPNIAAALEVSLRPDAPYHLLESYAALKTAKDFIIKGPTQSSLVAGWAVCLADALAYMESRNPPVFHGDISPRNICIDNERAVLVDFGLSYLGDQYSDSGVVGTAPYRPPERDQSGTPWPAAGDVYSLGVVLCELLFGELPYCTDSGTLQKASLRQELFDNAAFGSQPFRAVLKKAISPNQFERYQNAKEFQQALVSVTELMEVTELPRLERRINLYVDEVLKLYNKGECNAENRGLDSRFSRDLYVKTELDNELLPRILNHEFALVVLAGNPGDGKTAFLQQLLIALGVKQDSLPLNHWIKKDESDWTFECVLDGSAADTDRGLPTAFEVLDKLFDPIRNARRSTALASDMRRTQLLAINDGKLLEYLSEREAENNWLVQDLLKLLGEEDGQAHPQIILVDLNRRSLVGGIAGKPDTFDAILSSLLEGGAESDREHKDPWNACSDCRAAASCHIRFNVDTLRSISLGPLVRDKLRKLLMLVHSRGRLHITIRELRSFLAYLIFGNQHCEEIHAELEHTSGSESEESVDIDHGTFGILQHQRIYFNRIFDTGAVGGKLFTDLANFDPAIIDNPSFDRRAVAHSKSADQLEGLFLESTRLPHVAMTWRNSEFESDNLKRLLSGIRRRALFEGRHSDSPGGKWSSMIAYRSADSWIDFLNDFKSGTRQLPKDLSQILARAISRTDNIPEKLVENYVAIQTAANSRTDLVVVRLFDPNDFSLRWDVSGNQATVFSEIPSAMVLEYVDGDPALKISVDLFEILMRFGQGYRLGAEELEGVAGHLQLFKNRLLAMPANEVCLVHPTLGVYKAIQQLNDGVRQIKLEALV